MTTFEGLEGGVMFLDHQLWSPLLLLPPSFRSRIENVVKGLDIRIDTLEYRQGNEELAKSMLVLLI